MTKFRRRTHIFERTVLCKMSHNQLPPPTKVQYAPSIPEYAKDLLSYDNPHESYQLIRKIGSGTYGDVYESKMVKNPSVFAAVKVIGNFYHERTHSRNFFIQIPIATECCTKIRNVIANELFVTRYHTFYSAFKKLCPAPKFGDFWPFSE